MITTLNHAQVICLTNHYSYCGTVWTGKHRLSDTLNNRTSEYVELAAVKVYKVHDPDHLVREVPELFLRKASLAAVAILKEVNETPTGRLYGYTPKQRHETVLFLPGFEVRGTLHLTGKYEVHGPLAAHGEAFIPVTDARATATLNSRVRIQAATILVRQSLIEGFYVSVEETKILQS